MRKFFLLLLALWITADKAPAKDTSQLVELRTLSQAHAWEAVGRVNLIGTGFCTGSLIAPDLVLTAAHCMYNKQTGERIATEKVEFLAGWRNGTAVAERFAKRIVIHRNYRYLDKHRLERVASDIALIELKKPIRSADIRPFNWAKRPNVGQIVEVVSYSKERADVPSLQKICRVLGRDPAVLVLSCKVTFGASGSPIFVMENGVPRIASVVSAKAEWKSREVALGASLGRPLQELIKRLDANENAFSRIESVSSDQK